jgi:hypothetical protein
VRYGLCPPKAPACAGRGPPLAETMSFDLLVTDYCQLLTINYLLMTIKKPKSYTIFISILILTLILLRIPSLFEPHWYGDEGVFSSLANAFDFGKVLYKDLWSNLPPGIFFIYYMANLSSSLSLFIAKAIALLFSIGSILLTYKITLKLFTQKLALFSTVISVILLGLPILDSNIANPEVFFLFFTLSGIYFSLKKEIVYLFFGGLSFGVSLLFCINPIFELIAICLYFLFTAKKVNLKLLKKLLILSAGVSISVLTLLFYLSTNNTFDAFWNQVIVYNINNVINTSSNSFGFLFFPNTILVRIAILVILVYIKFALFRKGKVSKRQLFMALWIAFSVFSILFHADSYLHYLIPIIPVFSILTALILRRLKGENFSINQFKNLTIFVLSIFFVLNIFSYGTKLSGNVSGINYYLNFLKYLTGKTDSVSYINFFGENTYQTYRLNSYLQQNYPDTNDIYIWTDNPWIYKLSNINPPVKYLHSYQAKGNIGEVKSSLIKNSPQLAIINPNASESIELISFLEENGYEYEKEFEEYEIYWKNF